MNQFNRLRITFLKALNIRLKYLTALLVISLVSFQVTSQQLPFAHLSISDGLEDTVIFAIEQDDLGFLWIATRTGINRFDGERFWTFGEDNGLPHNLARDILKTQDGTLWIAGERGIAWFDGTKFNALKDWPDKVSAREFTQAPDGTIWVATFGAGVLQVSTGKDPKIIKQYNTESGLPSDFIRSILLDSKGNLWLGMSSKVVFISEGKIQELHWNTEESEIRTIYQHKDGDLWFGTRHGVAYFNGESVEALNFGEDLSQQTINSITDDQSGNIWLGTRGNGVYKMDADGEFTQLDMTDGLPDNSVNTIFQDSEKNLWFGTYGGGIARLSTSKVLNWKAQVGLPNPNVYAIAEDKKGCIWFGTNGNGVSQLCDGKFTHITKNDGLPHNKVLTTIVDNNGDPWFGTLDGLSHYKKGKFINYGEIDGMSGMVSYQVLQTKDNSLWIGTNNGLNRLIGNQFVQFSKKQGLPDNRINRIIESSNGGLWLATANGLSKYDDGQFMNWSTDDGLPANFINDIYQDNDGGLWIASNRGLGLFKNGEFKNWTTKDGLPHNNCTVILPGKNGEIWIGTNRGVTIFDGENFTVITSREGLVFDLINRGAGYRDSNGNLWFGTGEGVSRFSTDYKLGASDPPPVHLLSVSNNEKILSLDKKAQIKHRNTSLLFDFSAISFQRAPDVQYRYRLSKNAKGKWRETRLRQLQIESLAPGNYVFEVTARIGKGQWNTKTDTFIFTVTPPFWQTWWFILVIISLIVVAFMYRNFRSKKHSLYLEKMVLKRTKQLEDLNQGLEWLANHDNLTRLANRNHVHEKLSKLSASNANQQLGIIIIDLDYFKKINDKYGHAKGDKALKEFAQLLKSLVRDNQMASRWGGEEFLIVCPDINANRLQVLVEQILFKCRALNVPIKFNAKSKAKSINLRCSMGYALTPANDITLYWEKTIQLADLALYHAKHSGRDCAIGYLWQHKPSDKAEINRVLADHNEALNQGVLAKIELH